MRFSATSLLTITSFASIIAGVPVAEPAPLMIRATGPPGKPYLKGLVQDQFKQGLDILTSLGTVYNKDYILPWLSYANGDSEVIRKATFSTGVADLNLGFGGSFTYLRAVWTDDASQACTNIRATHQSSSYGGQTVDIAAGSGGEYRFLWCDYNKDQKPLKALALLRQKDVLDRSKLPFGYKWATADINEGRSSVMGQRLYIIFSN